MSVYMPKINYILLIYRNLFLTPIHASKLLLLNSLMEFLGTNTDIHIDLTLSLLMLIPRGLGLSMAFSSGISTDSLKEIYEKFYRTLKE